MSAKRTVKIFINDVGTWIYVVGFLDLLAVSIIIPALPSYMKFLGASPSQIGGISSIYGGVQLFSSPILGKLSDLRDRRSVLLVSILLSAFGYFLSIFYATSLFFLTILRFLPGLFKHTQDLSRSCLSENLTSNNRTKVLGIFNAVSSAGFIIGPSLHGYFMQVYGPVTGIKISFALCAIIFCVNAGIVYFVIIPLKTFVSDENMTNSDLKSKYLHKDVYNNVSLKDYNVSHWKIHQAIFVSRFLLAFSVMIFRSTFVLWIINYFPDYSSQALGYILSYNGFLGLVFGFSVGPLSTISVYFNNEEKMQLHATVLIVLSLSFLSLFGNIIIILLSMTILTLGTAIARVCGVALTTKYCKSDEIGALQGLGSSFLSVARFASPFVGGILLEIGFWLPLVVASFSSMIGFFVYFYYLYMPLLETKIKRD